MSLSMSLPMSLPIPGLDDKRFHQLADEALKLIPLYAPRWTDHNLHDPGITLIHLLAWLTEMHLYGLDRVTDAHLLKYLALLGHRPRCAVPPQAAVQISAAVETHVPAGTVFSTLPDSGGLLFESVETIGVLPVTIGRVVNYSYYRYADVTPFNSPSPSSYYPFGQSPGTGEALYIGFHTSLEPGLLGGKSFNLSIFNDQGRLPPAGGGRTVGVDDPLADFPVIPSAVVQWEYWNGLSWGLLSIDSSAPAVSVFSADGVVTIHFPNDLQRGFPQYLPADIFRGQDDEDCIWVRCRLVAAQYELPPRIHRIIPNVVTARALMSDSATHQSAYLSRGTIQAGSLVYCNLPGLDVVNPYPSTPRREAQTIRQAFQQMQKDLQLPGTAVTASDYETIIKDAPGLRVARARALIRPGEPNHVTVAVVPYSFQPRPVPSHAFKRTLCRYLEAHRPVTTRVTICEADYVNVSVQVSITLTDGAAPLQVETESRAALDQFLSPLTQDGGGWPFGRPVYSSEVMAVLENVQGVRCVSSLTLNALPGQGVWQKIDGDVVIGSLSLVCPGVHQIQILDDLNYCNKAEVNHE